MKKLICTFIFLSLASSHLLAQTESQTTSFSIEGQIVVATNGEAVFLNIGGPAIKFVFPKFSLAVMFLPALKFEDDPVKPLVTPLLTVGPQLYFLKDRRFVVSFPCYYNSVENEWRVTAGLGYVITKPKK